MKEEEHNLQVECVTWFRWQYRDIAKLLFAVPNGGARSQVTGAKMKAEGVTAGVADLLLLIPNAHHHCLAIEMKTKVGRQSPAQKEWQQIAESHGVRYVVARNVADFIHYVSEYLRDK